MELFGIELNGKMLCDKPGCVKDATVTRHGTTYVYHFCFEHDAEFEMDQRSDFVPSEYVLPPMDEILGITPEEREKKDLIAFVIERIHPLAPSGALVDAVYEEYLEFRKGNHGSR